MTSDLNTPISGGFHTLIASLRKRLFWGGLVMTVLGFVAVMMPMLSSVVVSVFIGWLLVLGGIVTIAGAYSLRGTSMFIWQLLAGLLPLVVGLLFVVYPLEGLVTLTVIIAFVLLLTGTGQVAFALWMRPAHGWVWSFLSALISLALGVMILVTLPEASAVVVGLLVGIDFLSTGIALILISRSITPAH